MASRRRVHDNDSPVVQAAAAGASPITKAGANIKQFQIYRWDPDHGGKPRMQTYEVDVNDCG